MFSAILFISCSYSFAADNDVSSSTVDSRTDDIVTKSVNTSKSTNTVSQSSIISTAKNVKTYVGKYKVLPNYVTISGYKYSMSEFSYLLSKTVVNKYKKSNSNIKITTNTINDPSKPSGNDVKGKIYTKNYYNLAVKNINYILKYHKTPNYLTVGSVKIQFQTSVLLFSNALNYYYSNKKLPSYVSMNVKSSNSINKNLPDISSSNINSNTKTSNNNAIWVQSKSFNSVNFSTLSNAGIGHIFLHEFAINQQGKTKVLNWAKNAAKNGIKVHLWIQAFYENGKWINPVDTSTKSYNQAYFNKILSKIKTYSKMSYIYGIHLDYLRYPGTAYKYSYSNGISGEKAITEFTRQAKKVINSNKPSLILSAAVMPETTSNAKYYGQNIPNLGKYLDVITPMIYKGNYGKTPSWITATTKWFVKNSGKAKIWGGIQTYKSDSDTSFLSTSALKTDSKAILLGGADGVAWFRWGLTNFFNLLSIY